MWRRLPTWFPNIRMQMLALTQEQKNQLLETGWLREVAFKTEPRVNKLEIRAFLESVYGMKVERVNTINYQGKKKRLIDSQGRAHWYRRSDWKKAYVTFIPPHEIQQEWEREQQQLQQARLAELREAALAKQRPNLLPAAAAAVAAAAAPQLREAAAAAEAMQAFATRERRAERRRRMRASTAAAAAVEEGASSPGPKQ